MISYRKNIGVVGVVKERLKEEREKEGKAEVKSEKWKLVSLHKKNVVQLWAVGVSQNLYSIDCIKIFQAIPPDFEQQSIICSFKLCGDLMLNKFYIVRYTRKLSEIHVPSVSDSIFPCVQTTARLS